MIGFSKKVLAIIEEGNYPIPSLFFLFVFSVILRNYLEVLVYEEVSFTNWYAHMHYSTYYLAIFQAIILLSSLITSEKILKVAKTTMAFSPVIILCPIVDFMALKFFGINQVLGYLSPELHGGYWDNFFKFFGSHYGGKGPSLGYRVEVATVLIGFAYYYYLKTKSWLPSFLGFVLSYLIVYFFCTTPYLLFGMGIFKAYSPQLVPYYMLVSLILFFGIFYRHNPRHFRLLLKDARSARMSVFVLLFVLGAVKGLAEGKTLYASNYFIGLFTIVAIKFAWMFSVMNNNLVDKQIDAVSSPNRPLILTSGIDELTYKAYMWFCFIIVLVFSAYADFSILYHMLLFMATYYIYSNPPFRLKRLPVLSKLPIAFNFFLMYTLGGTYVGYSLDMFPTYQLGFILIGGTFGINLIDIKDYEGDKKAGIKTLPVILGKKNAKVLTGLIVFCLYAFSGPFVKEWNTYLILLAIGLIQLFLIIRRNYSDTLVIWFFVLTILVVILEPFVLIM